MTVSDQVRHKPDCTITKDDWRIEMSDREIKGLYYLCSENNGADQPRGYREADLCLCLCIFEKQVFS